VAENFPDCLSTPRLRLRRLQQGDGPALCAYRAQSKVARYQYWESFGPDDAARLIESQSTAEPNIPGTWLQLAIVQSATGDLIGDCGLHCRKEDPRQMEIGITLAPRHQGHRYADEAIECLLDYVFGRLEKHRVFAAIDVLNLPAIALCRRLGFRQEAHFVENLWFKGAWGSEYAFAMLKREWEQRRAPRQKDEPDKSSDRTPPSGFGPL
jgi:RimJ/RimL family protein N-acetyltransferase